VTPPTLTFLGAAGTVTGAKFLLDAGGARLLLECGMFQGLRTLRERNWAPPPEEMARVDAVLLSHAHIDHSGWRTAALARRLRRPARHDLVRPR
jgi:metallo-beta-lactamase family protein